MFFFSLAALMSQIEEVEDQQGGPWTAKILRLKVPSSKNGRNTFAW